MSKSIRIKDYLYEQIERLATENRRPLIGQLEILLEQALKMERSEGDGSKVLSPASPSETPRTIVPVYEKEFKPDFKPTAKPKKGFRK